ncbi:polymer-forming cytoskeletal protein [Luteimonas sp. MJ250]|uniref:polymer-forming cytoskeletal protein n=1 Tax=Luteimonas sp. MJ250 TaxID=3129236 RepID=UPI0031B9B248
MDIRQTPRFALLFIAALAAGSALAAEDINRVNGAITAHAGSEYGRLETVNGSITLDDGARSGDASTVNGAIRAGNDIASGGLSTVNGGIHAGERARIGGSVETVNGSVFIGRDGEVEGDVETVNGAIGLVATVVAGDVGTSSGNVTIGAGSHVRGRLHVDKPSANWMPIRISTRRQRIIIGPGAVVDGPLEFEREVTLYVHDSARVGEISGATPVPYSTPTAPPRASD